MTSDSFLDTIWLHPAVGAIRIQLLYPFHLRKEKSTLAIDETPAPSADGIPPLCVFPGGIFGRADELAALLGAANRPGAGQPPVNPETADDRGCALALVHGPPGIGKSALLAALRSEVRRRGGWCANGAYADSPLPVPYSGLATALTDLARQLLAEPVARLRPLQQRLQAALGSSSALLASLAPDLDSIFGAQLTLTMEDAGQQTRLAAALRIVFGLLSEQGSPTVLCLDDIQWADSSSLEILRCLALEAPCPNLLLVVALRTETAILPALQVTLAEIRRQRPDHLDLALAPLDAEAIAKLLRAATAGSEAVDVVRSVMLLHAFSHGNPLLVRQALHAAGEQISWRRSEGGKRWVWNPAAVAGLAVGEQLRKLLALRLRQFDAVTVEILTAAACVGREFEGEFLAALLHIDPASVAAALAQGVKSGLLVTTGEVGNGGADASPAFHFAHGEVQRILLEQLDDAGRRHLHRRIGDRLLRLKRPGGPQETIFLIAGHLAAALHPAQDKERAAETVALFVEAARAALALAAIRTAADYIQQALQWLEALPGGWRLHYSLHLEVHDLAARAALYTADYSALAHHSQAVMAMAQSPLDKASVYKSCITGATLQGEYERALDLLHDALTELGVRLPRTPPAARLLMTYARTRLSLRRFSDTALAALPTTSTRAWWIIGDLATSAYMAMQWGGKQLLMAYISLQGVRWSLQHGHTPLSVISYALYSVLLTNRLGDPAAGARFGQLAAKLSERPENHHQAAGVLLTLESLVVHRTEPLAATLDPLREARRLAMQQGDVRLATDCTLAYVNHAQLAGAPLDALSRELAALLAELEPYGETAPLLIARMQLQNLRKLAGDDDRPLDLTGSVCDAGFLRQRLEQTDNRFGLHAYYNIVASLGLLFGDPPAAVQAADEARRMADTVNIGLFAEAVCLQVDAMARLARYEAAGAAERQQLLAAVRVDLKQLRRWAERSPINHRHRLHQVEAELARLHGRKVEAEQHYAAGWALAAEQGFVQDEGGIAELAARHFLRSGQWELAAEWRRRACAAYTRWGSRAKLRYLEQTLPALSGGFPTAGAAAAEAETLPYAANQDTANQDTANQDTARMTPAAEDIAQMDGLVAELRALSAHGDPERVVAHLLAALLAQLPAAKATFLLRQDQHTILYATQSTGQPAADFPELVLADEAAAHAPLAIIRLALHQGKAMRANAEEVAGLAGGDPYYGTREPQAVICVPLVAHGHTVALLLLEGAREQLTGAGRQAGSREFSARDAVYTELLGTRAALLVENSHLRRRLIDAMTPSSKEGHELSAWLLGAMRVTHRGQEITAQLQGRLRYLVALLLLQPPQKPITRAEIASTLWPDTGEGQALTNVRNLLHKLRTAWPATTDLLEVGRQQIHWKPAASPWVDVHAFERGLDEAGRLEGAAAIHLLRSSVALYTGDLLPGANDEWLLPRREHLAERRLAALSRLANLLIDQHDFAGALHYARQLVSADPLREESYRRLLRAQALAGDLAAAEQTYVACASMLSREFDAPPSPATEALYRQFFTGA